MVRDGILKGIRGPHGGYALARERKQVTANDILRAAATVEGREKPHSGSELLNKVVLPALAKAEEACAVALNRISVEDMARSAETFE